MFLGSVFFAGKIDLEKVCFTVKIGNWNSILTVKQTFSKAIFAAKKKMKFSNQSNLFTVNFGIDIVAYLVFPMSLFQQSFFCIFRVLSRAAVRGFYIRGIVHMYRIRLLDDSWILGLW